MRHGGGERHAHLARGCGDHEVILILLGGVYGGVKAPLVAPIVEGQRLDGIPHLLLQVPAAIVVGTRPARGFGIPLKEEGDAQGPRLPRALLVVAHEARDHARRRRGLPLRLLDEGDLRFAQAHVKLAPDGREPFLHPLGRELTHRRGTEELEVDKKRVTHGEGLTIVRHGLCHLGEDAEKRAECAHLVLGPRVREVTSQKLCKKAVRSRTREEEAIERADPPEVQKLEVKAAFQVVAAVWQDASDLGLDGRHVKELQD